LRNIDRRIGKRQRIQLFALASPIGGTEQPPNDAGRPILAPRSKHRKHDATGLSSIRCQNHGYITGT
jgi:hypothetical protein